MRGSSAFAALLLLVGASPSFAGDANVPQSSLNSLGLGGMQAMSDAEGMRVRGRLTFSVRSTGSSLYAYQLMGPTMTTGGTDADAATSTASGVAATTSLVKMDSLLDGLFFASVSISIGSSGVVTVTH